MRGCRLRCSGFTLIELMITVAIIGILASLAIPQFLAYQARSRRSEAYANLGALAHTQKAYHAEFDAFAPATQAPGGALSTEKRVWDAAAKAVFGAVGWEPEGAVYYDYDTNTVTLGGTSCSSDCSEGGCFTATAYGDVDGNGKVGAVIYVHPNEAGEYCKSALFGYDVQINPASGNPIYNAPAGVTVGADRF